MTDIIWEATLDKGVWKVVVTRSIAQPDRGELRIYEGKTGNIRHTTLVPLKPFGPDTDDVNAWQAYVIDWVDHNERTAHHGN